MLKPVRKINRRKFLLLASLAAPAALAADARWVEPDWLKTRPLRIGEAAPTHRFIHFSDLHYKGDRDYAEEVVKTINSFSPDFVCFTGDLIEDGKHLPATLEILSGIKSPLYGVPGNHDYWSRASFKPVRKCFAGTGGAWLMDQAKTTADGKVNIIGAACAHARQTLPPTQTGMKNILLLHYPAWVKKLGDQKFDLMLAGHSHGGQVRIPFYGPLIVPFAVDEYDMGLFQTRSGPLYVNPGIGYLSDFSFRFNCRPEITVIEI